MQSTEGDDGNTSHVGNSCATVRHPLAARGHKYFRHAPIGCERAKKLLPRCVFRSQDRTQYPVFGKFENGADIPIRE